MKPFPSFYLYMTAAFLFLATLTLSLFFFQNTQRHSTSRSDVLVTVLMPAGALAIEGEWLDDAGLHALSSNHDDNGTVTLSGSHQNKAVILRLINPEDRRFYDVTLAKTISLSGFDPFVGVDIQTPGDSKIYSVPMDWNGRITLPAPSQTPYTISFSQNDRLYKIDVTQPIGGAS